MRLLLLAAALSAAVWSATAPAEAAETPASTSAAPAVRSAVMEGEKGPFLVGEVTREEVVAHFPAWNDSIQAYRPEREPLARLAAVTRPIDIICVFGTWCGDSRREVPRLWRTLDLAANPNLRLRLLAVGRKDDAAALAKAEELGGPRDPRADFDVTLVPTFIFRAGDEELGRIIETPTGRLEADAAGIVAPVATAAPDSNAPGAPGGLNWK